MDINQRERGPQHGAGVAPTNWREDPGRFTRKVRGGGAMGLIFPLLDYRI